MMKISSMNYLPLNRKHKEGVFVFKFDEVNEMISTNLPGWFPITSARENAYILVICCYYYTNNPILAAAIKSHRSKHIEEGYEKNSTGNSSYLEYFLYYNGWIMKQAKISSIQLMQKKCHLPRHLSRRPPSTTSVERAI